MIKTSLLRNCWYVGAWSDEVAFGRPMARTILAEPVVFLRYEDGSVNALADRCPHRYAPLHQGRQVGDQIHCPYHGLGFDRTGTCVHNPHAGTRIPSHAVARTFPVVERYAALWVWMGDGELADPDLIPDFQCHVAPDRRLVKGVVSMGANYRLINDNLLDLSHVEFLHPTTLASEAIARGEHAVHVDGLTVRSDRWCPDGAAPPAWGAQMPDHEGPVDHWLEMRWTAPSMMLLDVGITPTGQPRSAGVGALVSHNLTPETETSTHYFWGVTRDWKTEDETVDRIWEGAIEMAFVGEDAPMVMAQQVALGDQDLYDMRPALFEIDLAPNRARTILKKLLKAEARSEIPEGPVDENGVGALTAS